MPTHGLKYVILNVDVKVVLEVMVENMLIHFPHVASISKNKSNAVIVFRIDYKLLDYSWSIVQVIYIVLLFKKKKIQILKMPPDISNIKC